jgi:hypothetical protein
MQQEQHKQEQQQITQTITKEQYQKKEQWQRSNTAPTITFKILIFGSCIPLNLQILKKIS